nr:PREDICTED: formin-like protein 5 [Apteryx mantelli mantelli]
MATAVGFPLREMETDDVEGSPPKTKTDVGRSPPPSKKRRRTWGVALAKWRPTTRGLLHKMAPDTEDPPTKWRPVWGSPLRKMETDDVEGAPPPAPRPTTRREPPKRRPAGGCRPHKMAPSDAGSPQNGPQRGGSPPPPQNGAQGGGPPPKTTPDDVGSLHKNGA